jgi:hypothetical protein
LVLKFWTTGKFNGFESLQFQPINLFSEFLYWKLWSTGKLRDFGIKKNVILQKKKDDEPGFEKRFVSQIFRFVSQIFSFLDFFRFDFFFVSFRF